MVLLVLACVLALPGNAGWTADILWGIPFCIAALWLLGLVHFVAWIHDHHYADDTPSHQVILRLFGVFTLVAFTSYLLFFFGSSAGASDEHVWVWWPLSVLTFPFGLLIGLFGPTEFRDFVGLLLWVAIPSGGLLWSAAIVSCWNLWTCRQRTRT